jgi:hypothetical protein
VRRSKTLFQIFLTLFILGTASQAAVIVIEDPPSPLDVTVQSTVIGYTQEDVDDMRREHPGADIELLMALYDGDGGWVGCQAGGNDCMWVKL